MKRYRAYEVDEEGGVHDIIEAEIRRYVDEELEDGIEEVCAEIEDEIGEINVRVHRRHAEGIAELEAERDRLTQEADAFLTQWRARCSALSERAEPLFSLIERELLDEAPDADDFDWPEPADGDEDDDPLYSSARDYLAQIDAYREHQGKGEEDVTLRALHSLTCEVCGKGYTAVRASSKTCGDECRRAKWLSENPTYYRQKYLDRKAGKCK